MLTLLYNILILIITEYTYFSNLGDSTQGKDRAMHVRPPNCTI